MCGIVGYTGSGKRDVSSVLLDGLRRLEYRGYDSAGLTLAGNGKLLTRKLKGRVQGLVDLVAEEPVKGRTGMAHTRWATHGAPTDRNAHPHADCTGRIALVHNGIIENAAELRVTLGRENHRFTTETDTEILAHLIEDTQGDTLEERVIGALKLVCGTYGLVVMSADDPDKLVVARHGSPVLLGIGEGEYFVASDASALLEHTRSVVYLDDGDVAVVTPEGYHIIDRESQIQIRAVDALDWELEEIQLAGYSHYMLKEIFEQPNTVCGTLRGRLLFDEGTARLGGLNLSAEDRAAIKRIVIVACGTSWHSGLVGRWILEELARIPVEVEYASEYRYRPPLPAEGTLTIAISQSGETADTLEALRAAQRGGSKVLGIVNAVGSTIARESNGGIYLHAGPEIGVASTKAFVSQIVALVLLGLNLGRERGLTLEEGREVVFALSQLPDLIRRALALEEQVKDIALEYVNAPNALYLGRGINFPVALEGALKLKEISYVHAEGYPAAEMKHGPIALIDEEMPVVFVAPADQVYQKIVANMHEVQARGGQIIALTSEGSGDLGHLVRHQLKVPRTIPLLSPVLNVVPLQMLAYHIAVLRGCDVDRPRNLAKSVTVE